MYRRDFGWLFRVGRGFADLGAVDVIVLLRDLWQERAALWYEIQGAFFLVTWKRLMTSEKAYVFLY
jgi:hypothetical protein